MRDFVLNAFNTIKLQHEAAFKSRHGLAVKTGLVKGDAVIKLLKPHWTTSPMQEIRNSNGVFFSVWLDESKPANPLLRYSLEAPKLRKAGNPKINAHRFAQLVRETGDFSAWPNIAFPKGPVIVFSGRKSFSKEDLVTDTTGLMERFAKVASTVDAALLQ